MNIKYKINNYVIRKNHGAIGFKRVGACIRMNPLNKRLTAVEESLNQVIETLNEIIKGPKIENINVDYD